MQQMTWMRLFRLRFAHQKSGRFLEPTTVGPVVEPAVVLPKDIPKHG
jgi:hypothetical protein